LNAQGNANPMTYTAKNGKQYVAIAAGGTVNVFTLP
jgi:glucose dehydrogenase